MISRYGILEKKCIVFISNAVCRKIFLAGVGRVSWIPSQHRDPTPPPHAPPGTFLSPTSKLKCFHTSWGGG